MSKTVHLTNFEERKIFWGLTYRRSKTFLLKPSFRDNLKLCAHSKNYSFNDSEMNKKNVNTFQNVKALKEIQEGEIFFEFLFSLSLLLVVYIVKCFQSSFSQKLESFDGQNVVKGVYSSSK